MKGPGSGGPPDAAIGPCSRSVFARFVGSAIADLFDPTPGERSAIADPTGGLTIKANSLADLLIEEPYRFQFYQAVRLFERIRAGREPVGHDGPPDREVVRFAGHLSLNFPPSEVWAIEGAGPPAESPPKMTTTFLGLIGASGAMPTVYTEALIGLSQKGRNAAALDFLDLFHHRLVSLFYRAWEKYNLPSLWERAARSGDGGAGSDPFSRHLYDLIGLGQGPLRDRQAIGDRSLLFYAGYLAQQHRPAVSLERLLTDHFGHPSKVLTFHGQWLRLEPDQRSKMGRLGAFNRLGVDTVVGEKVWDDQGKFRVRVGPLGLDEFRDFLPGGRLSDELMDLVRFFARGELDFDVQLVLKADEVPRCRMSRDPRAAGQLGRTSWLGKRGSPEDADDAVFKPVES